MNWWLVLTMIVWALALVTLLAWSINLDRRMKALEGVVRMAEWVKTYDRMMEAMTDYRFTLNSRRRERAE